jgi:hypothetical protein
MNQQPTKCGWILLEQSYNPARGFYAQAGAYIHDPKTYFYANQQKRIFQISIHAFTKLNLCM